MWLAQAHKPLQSWQHQAYLNLINDQETIRHRRFKFPHLQDQFLLTRALLRTTLSRYAPIDPSQWQFASNEWGRPRVAPGQPDISFNLSHSGHWIVVAISNEREIGVDVEYRNRRNRVLHIADRFFSANECRALHALPQFQRRQRFFTYWTLKEAYIKARGMGLAIPLGHFSLNCDNGPAVTVEFSPNLDDHPDRWQFYLYQPDANHQLAVCIERRDSSDRVRIQTTVPLAD